MRIVISAGMAGASGVASARDAAGSEAARRWLTDDINAAVEGAMENGATAFVLHLGGGPAQSDVLLDLLHPAVEVIRGRPLVFYEETDLARGYDGAFMIGLPARAGQNALLSRVLSWPLIREVRLNGQPVGEAELAASLAAAYGIRTVLVAGDDRVCLDMQRWSGGKVEAAVVKYSLSRHMARCVSLIEARERIRNAASKAVDRLGAGGRPTSPLPSRLEVDFDEPEVARAVARMPEIGYDGGCTVRYLDEDFKRVYRVLVAMFWIATSRLNE